MEKTRGEAMKKWWVHRVHPKKVKLHPLEMVDLAMN